MFEWLSQATPGIQLVVNIAALIGGAAVWKMYIDNLKAALTSKGAEISNVEKNRDFWKDKAQDLEKRSPEFMEKILAERIGTREAEIKRLAEDKEKNFKLLQGLEQEKSVLNRHLERTKGFRQMLALDGQDDDDPDDPLVYDENFEVVQLGEVAVDSGQLMITDPYYIDSEWLKEPFDAAGTKGNANNYSYAGASRATFDTGHGELAFPLGYSGAAVAFRTAFGDGLYPVYGEKHHGRITRVYINVA